MTSPQAFGPYELTERINIGGMAEVFRAVDRPHHRLVALKRILPSVAEDEEFIEMFRDEAAIASQLDHPNIARIYDVGRINLSYYLALEFVNGKDLRVVMERATRPRQPLPIDFVLHVVAETALGLDYAHHREDARGRPLGVVHRDVSPQNILVSFDGDVKIIDFGIAKAAGKLTRTQVGAIKGKFGYMSPEQVRGLPIDQRSDVFALGICLWELITLDRLFAGDNEVAIMEKIRACEIPSLGSRVPNIPAELEEIVAKALAKDADERYATAGLLHLDLTAFARTQGHVLDRAQASEYMRSVFAGDPALHVSREEKSFMAEQKTSSDLDVFEGLSKKNSPEDEAPTPFLPPVGALSKPMLPPLGRHKTLLGMPSAGPPPGRSQSSGPPFAPPAFSPTAAPVPPPLSRTSVPPPPGRGRSIPPAFPPGQTSRPPTTSAPTTPPPLKNAAGLPNTVPPAPPTTSNVDVEMDWDEDEQTSVFEKSENTTVFERPGEARPEAAAKPLPAPPPIAAIGAAGSFRSTSVATTPPPPPIDQATSPMPLGATPSQGSALGKLPPISRPGATPPPSRALAQTLAVPRERGSVTAVLAPQKPARNRYAVIGAGALIVAGAAFFLLPRSGKVAVFVASAAGKPLSKMTIAVDGTQRCSDSPCNVELDKGVHAIKVSAEGYTAQEQGATVRSGEELAVNFKLEKASAGTGIKVSGKQDGVELFVDGKEIGPLPQEVKDLAAGSHKVVIKGTDRYAPDERSISVDADEIKDLGSVSLKVLRGLATFDLRTTGAKVTLVSGKDRRQLSDFSQPVEIETAKNWSIEATKSGFEDFKQPISFDERAEKTFTIALQERSRSTPEPVAAAPAPRPAAPEPRAAAPAPAPAPAPVAEPAAPETEAKTPSAGGGTCSLNFNSLPVSNVVFDGKPIGGTPKVGYSAAAGTHTVIFINAEEGKKVTSVTCRSGESKTVAVRLTQ